ncbi:MAG: PPC domain-containing protein [Candidatus Choladocola sp.]|nr:PPC domain-containing protein [Candidatus Choladocola sp.]
MIGLANRKMKISVTLIMFLISILFFRNEVHAGSNLSTATWINIGSTVTGSMQGGKVYYKFTLPQNSVIHYEMRTGGHDQHLCTYFRDASGVRVDSTEATMISTQDSYNWGYQSGKRYLALNAGTYYMEVYNSSYNMYSYSISLKLVKQQDTYTKIASFNNKYLMNAQPLTIGNQIFSVSETTKHYYKITVPSYQTVKFTTNTLSENGNVYVSLYNSSGQNMGYIGFSVKYGNPVTCTQRLNAGVYYIGVDSTFSSLRSRYTIQTSYVVQQKGEQKITAANKVKTIGQGDFYIGAKLSQGNGNLSYSSGNTSVVSIDRTGKVRIRGVGKAVIKISASATSTYKEAVKYITITIRPKASSISSLSSPGSKQLKIAWKKVSGISGYQIQYGKKSSFSGAKTKNISAGKTKLVIKNCSKKMKYYVRIRTYRTVSGIKFYSSWSRVKSARTK